MNIIYTEYKIRHNSINIATTAWYLLRIDYWEAEKGLLVRDTYGGAKLFFIYKICDIMIS